MQAFACKGSYYGKLSTLFKSRIAARQAIHTMQVLAAKMAALENTKAAVVTASGMAAISSTLLTLLKSGDHMLVQQSLYGGSEIFFTNDLPDWGITFTRVDADKPDTWAAAVKSNTKVTTLSA